MPQNRGSRNASFTFQPWIIVAGGENVNTVQLPGTTCAGGGCDFFFLLLSLLERWSSRIFKWGCTLTVAGRIKWPLLTILHFLHFFREKWSYCTALFFETLFVICLRMRSTIAWQKWKVCLKKKIFFLKLIKVTVPK